MQGSVVQKRRGNHSEAAGSGDNSHVVQKLWKSSMTARVVLCPKMKAPTTMVMTPHIVKIPLW